MHPVELFVIIVVLVAVNTITQLHVRAQRLATYWIEPLALLVLCWIVIDDYTHWHWRSPPWYLVATIIGIIIGLVRGRATTVELGEKPRTFTVQGSWITIILLLLISGTNIVARVYLHGQAGVNIQQATSPLILVTAFNQITWRAVMLSRYLKLRAKAPTNA
jgi:hypothetical protein